MMRGLLRAAGTFGAAVAVTEISCLAETGALLHHTRRFVGGKMFALTLMVLFGGAVMAGAATTKPAAPTNLVFTSTSTSALAWQDNAGNEDWFAIERCSGVGCADFGVIATTAANAAAFTDVVFPETVNRYRVRAWNDRGYSAYSNVVERSYLYAAFARPTAQFLYAPPGGDVPLTVTFDASVSVALPGDPLSGWEWWFGDNTSASGQVVTHTFTSPATFAVTLRVSGAQAIDVTAGNVSVLAGLLVAPNDLGAITPAKSQVLLTWTNRAYDATTILVQRCQGVGCSSFATIGDLGSSATSFTDGTVGRNRKFYSYRLIVINDASSSAVSNVVSVRTR